MSTYVPIQAITLSSATATVTFTGIPQTYTDLVLVATIGNSDNANRDLRWTFNADSGSNYSLTFVAGNGSTAYSGRDSNATFMRAEGSTNNSPVTPITINIQNYANQTTNKTALSRSNASSWVVAARAHLWRSTAAINSISFTNENNANFVSGSTFTLYGVGSGAPKAFGGDEVRTDGTYWYHIFRSSGRFEPVQALSNVDYLVVAGGGGGGGGGSTYAGGGGGGAGGLRCTVGASGRATSPENTLSLAAGTSFTVTVGAGGTGGAGYGGTGVTNGSNSVFSTITSLGGGYGGSYNANFANTGGSGGGGGGEATSPASNRNGAAGTTAQGFGGGNGINGSAGGGGGTGAAGNNATGTFPDTNGGAGGSGTTTSISGTSTTYAGGGGGGGDIAGGAGSNGGGAGGTQLQNGFAATANTGGGGGGAGSPDTGGPTNGGNGGSGIVIVRYLV